MLQLYIIASVFSHADLLRTYSVMYNLIWEKFPLHYFNKSRLVEHVILHPRMTITSIIKTWGIKFQQMNLLGSPSSYPQPMLLLKSHEFTSSLSYLLAYSFSSILTFHFSYTDFFGHVDPWLPNIQMRHG